MYYTCALNLKGKVVIESAMGRWMMFQRRKYRVPSVCTKGLDLSVQALRVSGYGGQVRDLFI